MRQTMKKGVSLLLSAVLLLSLCPVPRVWAANGTTDSGQVLEASGWTDAGWNGVTQSISQEGNAVKISIDSANDTTDNGTWRATSIKKDGLSGISNINKITLQYTSDGTNNDVSFSAQLGANDANGQWQTYGADGTYDSSSGKVTFSDFKKDNEVIPSSFSPTQLVIQIGSNNKLPSEMTLSDITIIPPETGGSSVEGPWTNNEGWGGLEPTFTVNGENAVTFTVNDTTAGTDWRKVVIQKSLSSTSGVGKVTLNCAADIGFFVQLSGTVNGNSRDYYADGTKGNGTVTFSEFKYKVNNVETAATAEDLSAFSPTGMLIQVGSNSTLPGEIALSEITIHAPEGGGDDPDPTPGGTTITNNGWANDYTGTVTAGGYFRVEVTCTQTITSDKVTLVLQGDNLWKTVSPSEGSDGAVRFGAVAGKTNVYYAEFAYADCIKAADLSLVKNILVQVNNEGIDSNNSVGATSVTIKYYANDPNPPLETGSLNKNCVAIGEAVTASLESGTGRTHQWYRVVGNATENGVAISSATSNSYTPTDADKGYWLYCVINGKVKAGPAAVVVSMTQKTIELPLHTDKPENTTIPAGETGNIAAVPANVMFTPGGHLKLTFESFTGSIDFVLSDKSYGGWHATARTLSNQTELTVNFDTLNTSWGGNVAGIGQIRIKNNGSSTLKVTKLEWVGPDIGVEEAPYVPTAELPFGGTTWERDWVTTAVTQDARNNLLTATAKYDGGEWSVARMKTHSDDGFIVGDNNMVSLNVYIEQSAMDTGKGEMLFQIIDCSGEFKLNTSGEENTVEVNGTNYYRTALNIPVTFPARFNDFILAVRGKGSTFDGKILVENITLRKDEGEKEITVALPGSASLKNNTPVTTTINSSNPKAYYGDAVKVTVALESRPTSDVTVTSVLNNDENTESKTVIPQEQFTQAQAQAQSRIRAKARAITNPWTATAEIPVPCTVGEVTNVKITATASGYTGDMELTELKIVNKKPVTPPAAGGGGGGSGGGSGNSPVKLPYTWKFSSYLSEPWKYEPGWNSGYSGKSSTSVAYRDGRLEVYVDYSKDGSQGWSQMAVSMWHDQGMSIKNATHLYLDLCYLPKKLNGTLTLKLNSGGAGIDTEGVIDWDGAKEVKIDGQTYKKVRVDFTFSPVAASTVHDMALCIVGRNTTYQGPLFIEAMTIEEAYAGTFVWTSQQAKKENSILRLWGSDLATASGEKIALPTQVTLADGKATAAVRSVYAYLQAVGESKDVLFGQQYNFGHKAGAANLSDSDTYDMVSDYSAVFGLDGLALAGAEFSAGRCNQLYGTPFPSTAEGNVVAAAYLTNTAIKRGAIATLSCHMPNFSQVKTVTPNCSATYAKYDFSSYTPNVLTGDTANEILPGGKYHAVFTAYLDMVADYANRVNGAVLFRPFHENTGSWFWWGASSCDAETYKNIYRYTVEYLRDEKNVHNFLYVYSPGSEASTLEGYGERYPGDSYVDLVGFDMYNRAPDAGSGWIDAFRQELDLVSRFAQAHGKLVAVTETGAANDTVEGDKQTALLRSGNKDPDWYRRVQQVVSDSPASYFLLWANFGKDNGFYTPYVMVVEGRKLYGHEMMKNFFDYYNDPHSVFASDQKAVLGSLPRVTAKAAGTKAEGYITAPISGRQIQDGTVFTARVARANGAKVQFVLQGRGGSVTLEASSADGVTYQAKVSKKNLDALGDCTNGTASLVVGGVTQQTIRLNSSTPFLDVPADAYYAAAVQWALAQGITSGTSAQAFSPNSPCTRAQAVTFLWRSAGSPAPGSQNNPFLDLQKDAYYYQAVLWAVEQGITAGVTETSFSPNATVTRGQMATFLYRYAGTPEVSKESAFRDVASTDYYAPAVRWASDKGITAGTTAETFSPNAPCTRAQIVTFLYRQQTASA